MRLPFKALFMAFGLFSVLPVPRNHWDEKSLPWVIPMMPLVGGVIGLLWSALVWAIQAWPMPLQCVAVTLAPMFLSGFFHLDGFMDTADAYFSRRDLEERKRILKDPHVGAFAVIALACFLMFQYGVVQTLLEGLKGSGAKSGNALIFLVFIPILSRCVTGLAMLTMKSMPESGYIPMLCQGTKSIRVLGLIALLIALPVALAFVLGPSSLIPAGCVVFVSWIVLSYLSGRFEGLSGDLCGAGICLGESAGLLTFVLVVF